MKITTEQERVTPPDDAWVSEVCRIGQGAKCCRFLMMGPDGWSCQKHVLGVAERLQIAFEAGSYLSAGDNCTGRAPQ